MTLTELKTKQEARQKKDRILQKVILVILITAHVIHGVAQYLNFQEYKKNMRKINEAYYMNKIQK